MFFGPNTTAHAGVVGVCDGWHDAIDRLHDSLSAPRLQYRHVTRRDVFRAESVREKNNDALPTILYKHRGREKASQPTEGKITSVHAIDHNRALLHDCFSPMNSANWAITGLLRHDFACNTYHQDACACGFTQRH